MKQAILFDFWQTLFHDSRERETFGARKELISDFLEANGFGNNYDVDAAFEVIRPRFWEVYHDEQRTPLLTERLSWLMEQLDVAISQKQLEELAQQFGEIGIMLNPRPTANAVEIVSQLSARFSLGIVSDTGFTPGRVLRRHLERHGILQHFTAFSFSDETGRAKPHPHQFLNALEQLGVEPENAIHCGDLPAHDIRGANQLGITSVLYTGCHESSQDGDVPDYTISDWLQLPDVVEKVFG